MPTIKPLPANGSVSSPSQVAACATATGGSNATAGEALFSSPTGPPSPALGQQAIPAAMLNGSSADHGVAGATKGLHAPPAASASDLLLSFLTQTVREMKEKVTSLEEENSQLRAKHRKLKQQMRESNDRTQHFSLMVSSLAARVTQIQQQITDDLTPSPRKERFIPASAAGPSFTESSPPSFQSPTSSQGRQQSAQPLPRHAAFAYRNIHGGSRSEASNAPTTGHPMHHLSRKRYSASSTSSYATSALSTCSYHPNGMQQQLHGPGVVGAKDPVGASTTNSSFSASVASQTLSTPSLQQRVDVPLSGFPAYSISSVADIKRHFPYLEECYFEKSRFVINDLRKPYLVIQLTHMDATTITASEAYCSISGFTMSELLHTKKLVSLVPRHEKRRINSVLKRSHEPKTTTTLEFTGSIFRKDGQIVKLEYVVQFFHDAHGKVKWLIVVVEKMVGVDKSVLYANFAAFKENDEERIKAIRDQLQEQERQEWDELTQEYCCNLSAKGDFVTVGHQQPAGGTTADFSQASPSASFPHANSSPPSPLSPMTSNWLAEMLATPPSTTPQQPSYN